METPLRKARLKANRTLTEVAQAAGMTKGTLSRIETGGYTPSTRMAETLAALLGNITELEILYPERYAAKAAGKRRNGRAA